MIRLQRAYYTCTSKNCRTTELPLDRMLGLSSHTAAGKFEEQICILAAHMPFDWVSKYLESFDGVKVTETMIRETTETCGQAMVEYDENLQANPDLSIPTKTDTLYAQIDGSMVPIKPQNRGEKVGYKENKLGVLFREEDIERQEDDSCKITQKRFASSLGQGLEHFEQVLKTATTRIGSRYARTVVVISDGAEWIDNVRKRLFPKSIHILDWYHAAEHLWKCGHAIFGEDQEQLRAWLNPLKQLLWDGVPEAVCERLLLDCKRFKKHQNALLELHSYYKPRFEKMRYERFRRKGYFIGSGAVESANKYLVQARCKQAGMKWTINGAAAVIKLREKIYEDTWDDYWRRRAA